MAELYLFRFTLKDLLLPKKLILAILLALIPSIIILIWKASVPAAQFQPEVAYNILSGDLIFGFVLVILTVVFGTGVVTQETEGKTIHYLLTRPVPRWRILLAKFVPALLVATGTVWAASIFAAASSYGIAGWGKSRLPHDLAMLPLGVLAYGSLFLLLAVSLKRPLVVGLLFVFGWESWVPNLPGSFQKTSLMAYLRVLAPHPRPETEAKDFAQLLMSANPSSISHAAAWEALIGTFVVALALALYLFSTREFAPRDDAG
jgi:ABC-type transport system involved in multi-copper enzyme maturation permease subunit